MPSDLASGDSTIFWWKGNVTPPKDYGKWEELIRNLTQHWTERYGALKLRHFGIMILKKKCNKKDWSLNIISLKN